jgi:NADH-quinone oxidoreductase subunit L
VGEHREAFWNGAIFVGRHNEVLEQIEHLPEWVSLLPLVMSVGGALIAIYFYLLHEGLAKRIADRKGPLWTFLYNKWFFDELYQATFVKGAKALGDLFWKGGDQKIIDGLGPNGFAWLAGFAGRQLGKVQTGYVYHYAFVMLLGVAGLLSFALWAFGR